MSCLFNPDSLAHNLPKSATCHFYTSVQIKRAAVGFRGGHIPSDKASLQLVVSEKVSEPKCPTNALNVQNELKGEVENCLTLPTHPPTHSSLMQKLKKQEERACQKCHWILLLKPHSYNQVLLGLRSTNKPEYCCLWLTTTNSHAIDFR